MKKKKALERKEGYTLDEARALTNQYIDESMERLRMRLREAWKKQATEEKKIRHGITA
jgi:hypothetical protein